MARKQVMQFGLLWAAWNSVVAFARGAWGNASRQYLNCLCVAGLLVAWTGTASAAMYSFTNIIDSSVAAPTGNYLNIGDAAISGNRVAFKAGYDQGYLGIIDSIFVSTGGPRTEVVHDLMDAPYPLFDGDITAIGRPVIDGGPVYFDAQVFYFSTFSYSDGIFFGEGLSYQNEPLLSTSVAANVLPQFAKYRTIADPLKSNGYLSYRKSARQNSALDTIQVRNPEKTSTAMIVGVGSAAPQGGAFSLIDANYDLSGPTAAFRGVVGGQDGIYTGTGGPLTTIVKKGDATPQGGAFDSVLDPTISGSTVAFLGTYAGGSGIFTGEGGALSTIVKTGDLTPGGKAFTGFSVPTMAFNVVAFQGNYAGGGGIYTKRGDELNKVVEFGDPLFGSKVASLTFSDLGLDAAGSGNLAFTYGLADGRTGVAMATPGAGLPTIFQDVYGKIPVPDSVGIVWTPAPDFSNRNLARAWFEGADLHSANGRNVNLTNAVLRAANLSNANLSGANLRGARFNSARLDGTKFDGADVRGASFQREFVVVLWAQFGDLYHYEAVGYGGITPAQLAATATYQSGDLSGIDLEGNDFSNAKLAGLNLAGANFDYAKLTSADLRGADIRQAHFGRHALSQGGAVTTGIYGTGITLEQLYSTKTYLAHELAGIDLSGNNLTGGNFADHNLANANFSAATLTDADFTGAEVGGTNFGIDIYIPPYGSGITFAQLSSTASYQAHDLRGVGLGYHNLRRWNFVEQNLTNANLSGAALTEADFSGAEIRGAIFNVIPDAYGFIGTGIATAQLYSTASYQAGDLRGVSVEYNDLTGANLAGQNLSNAKFYAATLNNVDLSQANLTNAAFGIRDFSRPNEFAVDFTTADLIGANLSGANLTNASFAGRLLSDEVGYEYAVGANLTGANLSGADARGANFFLANLADANTANLIQPNGHIADLDLAGGSLLVVRDYDGNPSGGVAPPTGPLPIVIDQSFAMDPLGLLRMEFDADAWNSTISFAAGIPVARGGSLELLFASGINAAGQIGRKFKLFDWAGVAPSGAFKVVSPYAWNLSNLYTTGEVTLAAVPEPTLLTLTATGLLVAAMFRLRRGTSAHT